MQIEIRVQGQIDEHWSSWFEDMTITHTGQGETILSGTVVDQAALYGLLAKLRDLGLPLVSVKPLGSCPDPVQSHESGDERWRDRREVGADSHKAV